MRVAARPRHNLPAHLSSFVGRELEAAEVERLLATTRLVTLTGAGGVGKTRLALRVAEGLLAAEGASERQTFPDGVWLVELAALDNPALVPHAVAAAVGVRERAELSIEDALARALRPKQLLLVLDNCEHLLTACAELADHLLRACPRLHILATSRQPLGLAGECAWRVPSLAVPYARVAMGTDEIAACEAVRLFLERGRSALPGFELTDLNAAPVAQICRRLDGIPLALELAAARVAALGVEQTATRLDDRFRLLTTGSRTAVPRHRTLRALVDWSHELLAAPERALFRRLAVFAGGWTLAAAEAVCASERLPRDEVLDLLAALVDRSLVVAEGQETEARYRLLETLRQYGWERLAESGERGALRRRHAAYFVSLAEQAEPELQGPAQRAWLDRFEQEHDNLRAALGWCREADAETGLRLACSLAKFWQIRGYLTEGRRWLGDLLTKAAGHTPARAGALYAAGELALRQGDYAAAQRQLEGSLGIYREVGDEHGVASSLQRLGRLVALQGEHERGRALMEESLAVFRATGDRWSIAWTLTNLVLLALTQGDHHRAQALGEESLTLFRAIGDKQGIGYALSNLGQAARVQGEYDRARALMDEALALFRELEDKPFIGRTLWNLGTVALLQGDFDRVENLLQEALYVLREVASERYLRDCVCLSGILAVRRGEHGRGARLISAVTRHKHVRAVLHPDELHSLDAALAGARAALGEEAFAQAWAEGEAMTLERAVEYALQEDPIPTRPGSRNGGNRAESGAWGSHPALTPREREVVALVAKGLSNRQIGEALVITEGTANLHVKHILNKLGFASRAQIAAWAVQQDSSTVAAVVTDRR